jgi:hypothetical protein
VAGAGVAGGGVAGGGVIGAGVGRGVAGLGVGSFSTGRGVTAGFGRGVGSGVDFGFGVGSGVGFGVAGGAGAGLGVASASGLGVARGLGFGLGAAVLGVGAGGIVRISSRAFRNCFRLSSSLMPLGVACPSKPEPRRMPSRQTAEIRRRRTRTRRRLTKNFRGSSGRVSDFYASFAGSKSAPGSTSIEASPVAGAAVRKPIVFPVATKAGARGGNVDSHSLNGCPMSLSLCVPSRQSYSRETNQRQLRVWLYPHVQELTPAAPTAAVPGCLGHSRRCFFSDS